MSIYNGYDYRAEERRREQERANAPKECPHCHTPINTNLGRYERIRQHCGRDACRAAIYRINKANRKEQARKDTRARILQYCNDHLTTDQRQAVMDMTDQVMSYNPDEGHQIALAVVNVMEAQRCKHDRIAVLINNANLEKRRAEKAREHALEIEALYQRRITELEKEIEIYQSLENAVCGIAQDQERKQPDPPEREELEELNEEEEDDEGAEFEDEEDEEE